MLKKRKLCGFFLGKSDSLKAWACMCWSQWPSKHFVGAEGLALKEWWFPAPLWGVPAARPGSPALLLSGVPERRMTVFPHLCLSLHAGKRKERGPISNTSRLHMSFHSSPRWHFFLCIYWVLWLIPKKRFFQCEFCVPTSPHKKGRRVMRGQEWMLRACSFNMTHSDWFCVFWLCFFSPFRSRVALWITYVQQK